MAIVAYFSGHAGRVCLIGLLITTITIIPVESVHLNSLSGTPSFVRRPAQFHFFGSTRTKFRFQDGDDVIWGAGNCTVCMIRLRFRRSHQVPWPQTAVVTGQSSFRRINAVLDYTKLSTASDNGQNQFRFSYFHPFHALLQENSIVEVETHGARILHISNSLSPFKSISTHCTRVLTGFAEYYCIKEVIEKECFLMAFGTILLHDPSFYPKESLRQINTYYTT